MLPHGPTHALSDGSPLRAGDGSTSRAGKGSGGGLIGPFSDEPTPGQSPTSVIPSLRGSAAISFPGSSIPHAGHPPPVTPLFSFLVPLFSLLPWPTFPAFLRSLEYGICPVAHPIARSRRGNAANAGSARRKCRSPTLRKPPSFQANAGNAANASCFAHPGKARCSHANIA